MDMRRLLLFYATVGLVKIFSNNLSGDLIVHFMEQKKLQLVVVLSCFTRKKGMLCLPFNILQCKDCLSEQIKLYKQTMAHGIRIIVFNNKTSIEAQEYLFTKTKTAIVADAECNSVKQFIVEVSKIFSTPFVKCGLLAKRQSFSRKSLLADYEFQ